MDLICIDYISYCFSHSSALHIWIWVLQRFFHSSHSPSPSSNLILYLEHIDISCGIAIVSTGNSWSSQLDRKYVFCITRINFILCVVQVTLNLPLDIYTFHATSKNASFQISIIMSYPDLCPLRHLAKQNNNIMYLQHDIQFMRQRNHF